MFTTCSQSNASLQPSIKAIKCCGNNSAKYANIYSNVPIVKTSPSCCSADNQSNNDNTETWQVSIDPETVDTISIVLMDPYGSKGENGEMLKCQLSETSLNSESCTELTISPSRESICTAWETRSSESCQRRTRNVRIQKDLTYNDLVEKFWKRLKIIKNNIGRLTGRLLSQLFKPIVRNPESDVSICVSKSSTRLKNSCSTSIDRSLCDAKGSTSSRYSSLKSSLNLLLKNKSSCDQSVQCEEQIECKKKSKCKSKKKCKHKTKCKNESECEQRSQCEKELKCKKKVKCKKKIDCNKNMSDSIDNLCEDSNKKSFIDKCRNLKKRFSRSSTTLCPSESKTRSSQAFKYSFEKQLKIEEPQAKSCQKKQKICKVCKKRHPSDEVIVWRTKPTKNVKFLQERTTPYSYSTRSCSNTSLF